jgi:cytochrome c5
LITTDRRFIDIFSIVVGALVAISMTLFILSRIVATQTQLSYVNEYPEDAAAVAERIKPFGTVGLPGDNEPAAQTAVAAAAPAVAAPLSGPQVYNRVCMACHAQGIGGAPKIGDKTAWGSRISQGANTLHDHALKGYQGKAGVMPQKGGRVDLSDKEIVDAVDYMVSQSR